MLDNPTVQPRLILVFFHGGIVLYHTVMGISMPMLGINTYRSTIFLRDGLQCGAPEQCLLAYKPHCIATVYLQYLSRFCKYHNPNRY